MYEENQVKNLPAARRGRRENKEEKMEGLVKKITRIWLDDSGMELVQVGILIAIAIGLGIIFKTEISTFVNDVFSGLTASSFK